MSKKQGISPHYLSTTQYNLNIRLTFDRERVANSWKL